MSVRLFTETVGLWDSGLRRKAAVKMGDITQPFGDCRLQEWTQQEAASRVATSLSASLCAEWSSGPPPYPSILVFCLGTQQPRTKPSEDMGPIKLSSLRCQIFCPSDQKLTHMDSLKIVFFFFFSGLKMKEVPEHQY